MVALINHLLTYLLTYLHESTLAVQNRSTSSTLVCVTINCYSGQLTPPAIHISIYCHVLSRLAATGLWRFPGYAVFIAVLPAERLARWRRWDDGGLRRRADPSARPADTSLPSRTSTTSLWPLVWIDSECRHTKCLGRRLERQYAAVRRRAADDTEVNAAKTAWYDQRRAYRQLRQRKCTAFWSERIDADQADPRTVMEVGGRPPWSWTYFCGPVRSCWWDLSVLF